jgi:SAM-dependent methyltransferase
MKEQNYSEIELKQKQYYDKIASEYNAHYASDRALLYRYDLYSNFLKDVDASGLKVLDAMCGGGQSTSYFLSKGAEVVGIDISEKQCLHYKTRFPHNDVFCQSMLQNDFPVSSFDFIVTDSVHHIHPYVNDCMQEFHRLLKPGGRLLIWEPSAGSIFDIARKIWYRFDRKFFEDNEKSIDLNRLVRHHRENLRLVKHKYGGNISYVFNSMTMPMRLQNKRLDNMYKFLNGTERYVEICQSRLTSLWFLALFQKHD